MGRPLPVDIICPPNLVKISRTTAGSEPGAAPNTGRGFRVRMPDVIMNGPEGRLEGRYQHGKLPNAPIALMLHPHPQHGGTMNNKGIYTLYHRFARRGVSLLRLNFRRVGPSPRPFDPREGQLTDP